MTPSTLLLSRAENRDFLVRQASVVIDRLKRETGYETSPALRVSLQFRIRIRELDRENDRKAAELYREAAEVIEGLP